MLSRSLRLSFPDVVSTASVSVSALVSLERVATSSVPVIVIVTVWFLEAEGLPLSVKGMFFFYNPLLFSIIRIQEEFFVKSEKKALEQEKRQRDATIPYYNNKKNATII